MRAWLAMTEETLQPRPIEEVKTARAFYAELGHDVRYFSALWHTFNVGHMLETDLDRICRDYDLSIADFNLIGALRIDHAQPLRATDLAVTLQVSNAALTARIVRLERIGILIKSPSPTDRRAFTLQLTQEGMRKVDAIHIAMARDSYFVRHFHQLPAEDRASLERIMGELHTQLDRYFAHTHR
jgi:DNA-binding MarR family transcriptional regulator